MSAVAVNLAQKLGLFAEHWSPRVVAEMNDGTPGNIMFKLVKMQGEFVWHSHVDTDETFIVVAGTLHMQFRDREALLHAGEMFVVPLGV